MPLPVELSFEISDREWYIHENTGMFRQCETMLSPFESVNKVRFHRQQRSGRSKTSSSGQVKKVVRAIPFCMV